MEAIARYEGQIYHAELAGTYQNGQWRSSVLGGRALSTMSGAESHRYGGKDPGRAEDISWFDQTDRFVAGFANVVSFGATGWFREARYGELATRNHQGTAYNIGTGVGIAASLALGGGAGGLLKANAAVRSGLRAYALVGDVVGVVQSSQAVYDTAWNGEPYNWTSLFGFLPTVGWGAGRLARGLRSADNLVAPARGSAQSLASVQGGYFHGEVAELTAALRARGNNWLNRIADRYDRHSDLVELLDDVDYDFVAAPNKALKSSGFYSGGTIYLRRSAGDDIVKVFAHEGTHALDFGVGGMFGRLNLDPASISPLQRFRSEIRAFRAERLVDSTVYPLGGRQQLVDFILRKYNAVRP